MYDEVKGETFFRHHFSRTTIVVDAYGNNRKYVIKWQHCHLQ